MIFYSQTSPMVNCKTIESIKIYDKKSRFSLRQERAIEIRKSRRPNHPIKHLPWSRILEQQSRFT